MTDVHPEDSEVACPGCRSGLHAPISRRSFIGGAAALGVGAAALPLVHSIPGVGAQTATPAYAPNPFFPAPRVISRAQWGANEALRLAKDPCVYDSTVTKIVVHHTASPSNPSDPAATVRGVYAYHTSGVYIDIAYNFLIDQNGNIYEGRWSRNLKPGENPNGESYAGQVRGGHALNTNVQTIGIAMIGTFTGEFPSSAALESLVKMCTWKCGRWGIDPRGSSQYLDGRVFPNIIGHRGTSSTECPGNGVEWFMGYIRDESARRIDAANRSSTDGYWIAGRNGAVWTYGNCADLGDPLRSKLSVALAGVRVNPAGAGYWAFSANGGVFSYGNAPFYGSAGALRLNNPIVAMAPRKQGDGYWLASSDGGVFSFGNAPFRGSLGGIRLNRPIVSMAARPQGDGYWMASSDGGVFSFGNAPFLGSMGGKPLNNPIVAMGATASGNGYWLCSSDGGIFTFGDARYLGSLGGTQLTAPVVDFVPTPKGDGYWMLQRDGRVRAFGKAPNRGSALGTGSAAVGLAPRLTT
ncbi:MAG: peptidoglycan recognition family protein [Acidimicrobiia bacterium]